MDHSLVASWTRLVWCRTLLAKQNDVEEKIKTMTEKMKAAARLNQPPEVIKSLEEEEEKKAISDVTVCGRRHSYQIENAE